MTTRSFGRFALFGDASVAVAPEFLHIEAISTRSSRHEWTIAAHTHPGIFQLLLLQSGSGVLVADQTTVALVPTALVALPSGSIHAFAFEEGAEGWVLSLATPLVGDLALVNRAPGRGIAALGSARAASGITNSQSRRLDWLMGEIAADFADHGAVHLSDVRLAMLTMLLAQCDEMLLQPQGKPAPSIGPPIGTQARHERLVQRFRAAVEAHFCAGWGLSRYAALLGTSTPTLTRACHSVLGRAPGEVVAARVQLEALRLLTYSALSISQIADQLGFADPAYFARFFKSRTGQTARAFREERAWLQTA
jgi:AraC family transcriptional activator of pobA